MPSLRDLYQSDTDYAQSLLNARRNAIPSALRAPEQGLQGGMELGSVGGIPVSLTDLIPADFGASTLATLGKAGATKLGALPVMAGIFAGKGVKTRSLAELIGKPRMASEYTAIDTMQNPLNTRFSPYNKYIENPNYNTGLDIPQQGGLPTKEQYENIIWKQRIDAKQDKQDFEEKMQEALAADAKRAANRRNVQSSAEIQNKLSDEEWMSNFQKHLNAAAIAERNSVRGWERQ